MTGVRPHGNDARQRFEDDRDLAHRLVVVVGGARSGLAAARLARDRGAKVLLTDTRPALDEAGSLRELGVELELGVHRPETFASADLVVLSPGVPSRQAAIDAARARGIPVIGEMEFASRYLRGRIVAVTGTKGKSTTTTLIGRMLLEGGLHAVVGGNIGLPLSAQVAQTGSEVVHVIEASSFQLEGIATFHPYVAVFLNFSPDHLDRHASVEEYAEAKRRIFVNQTADDRAVVNAEDERVMVFASHGRARLVPFALNQAVAGGVCVADDTVVWREADEASRPLVPLSSVQLLGRHLLQDVLAAAAVAHLFGVEPAAMRRAVEGFRGLEHALEPVAVISGRQFVNDSKATNVEAARRAIESFGPGLVVIMGGRFKGGDLGALREPLRARRATVIAIGEARSRLRDAFGDVVRVEEAATLGDAVQAAFEAARPGSTVLLAPACASFDMFHDYAERGRVFKEEVARLASAMRERASTRET